METSSDSSELFAKLFRLLIAIIFHLKRFLELYLTCVHSIESKTIATLNKIGLRA